MCYFLLGSFLTRYCAPPHYPSSLTSISVSVSTPPRAPHQDSYCLLSWWRGLFFFFFFFLVLGASHLPFPILPQRPPCPEAIAMEICFSHIANYLRVVTSLTVLGDNEWLIGHSSRRRCVLLLPPPIKATCLTGCASSCCPFSRVHPPHSSRSERARSSR